VKSWSQTPARELLKATVIIAYDRPQTQCDLECEPARSDELQRWRWMDHPYRDVIYLVLADSIYYTLVLACQQMDGAGTGDGAGRRITEDEA
jgi:hypothetical protein